MTRETSNGRWRYWGIALAAICFAGCSAATKPLFYLNDHFEKVGSVQADVDTSYCMTLADNYVKEPNKYGDMAKEGAFGGAVGAGTGAVAGTIMKGQIGRSTAAGAAVGAIVSIVHELRRQGQRSPTYERFVEHSLHKKGYEVTGWQ